MPAIIAFRRVFPSTVGLGSAKIPLCQSRFADACVLGASFLRRRGKKRRIQLRFSQSDRVQTLSALCIGRLEPPDCFRIK